MLITRVPRRLVVDDSAATAMEYSRIAALMGLGAMAAGSGVGMGINDLLALCIRALLPNRHPELREWL